MEGLRALTSIMIADSVSVDLPAVGVAPQQPTPLKGIDKVEMKQNFEDAKEKGDQADNSALRTVCNRLEELGTAQSHLIDTLIRDNTLLRIHNSNLRKQNEELNRLLEQRQSSSQIGFPALASPALPFAALPIKDPPSSTVNTKEIPTGSLQSSTQRFVQLLTPPIPMND